MRRVGVHFSAGRLSTSFTFRDAFTQSIREKLKSGLPTKVVAQINLELMGKRKPISLWVRSATIVYDLWEEAFFITMEDNRGRRQARLTTAKGVIDTVGMLENQPIAYMGSRPPGTFRLRVLVEVNPVSKEMVANIRRWLAKPPAGSSGVEQQTNFFGSFVGIFVDRRIGQADKRIVFVSQWFEIGGP
ncbi:MAG: hypothetical protein QNJ97_15275 [Myxococcota bacterium]|nr:hypothetical protein [Myxococcota bacterium]